MVSKMDYESPLFPDVKEVRVITKDLGERDGKSLTPIVPFGSLVLLRGEFTLSPISITSDDLTKADKERDANLIVVGYGQNTKSVELGDRIKISMQNSMMGIDVPGNKKSKKYIKTAINQMEQSERNLLKKVDVVEYFLLQEYDIAAIVKE